MYQLDDTDRFVKVLDFSVARAETYGNTDQGRQDHDKRARFRDDAMPHLKPIPDGVLWWAFRITVRKSGRRPFDLENVPKPIIDSFCAKQLRDDSRRRDVSMYAGLGLYEDDTIDHVRLVLLLGSREDTDSTRVEVFACVAD